MSRAATVEVRGLRVFCRADGSGGNQLGVVLDGGAVERDDRQALAARLGYSETVFVDDPAQGRVAIYTPEVELPFAGHPTVGTAWLLAQELTPVEGLRTSAGKVPVRRTGDETFVAGRAEWCPPFELEQLEAVEAVDADPGVEGGELYLWAWIDEPEGIVRARAFVPGVGIPEDEATGSAALRLCAELGRAIEVHQGRGSLIHARPIDDGLVEIGGLVVED